MQMLQRCMARKIQAKQFANCHRTVLTNVIRRIASQIDFVDLLMTKCLSQRCSLNPVSSKFLHVKKLVHYCDYSNSVICYNIYAEQK